ncbi:hypothetical protein CW304_02705 [Bacillus sp. UFRGS-B20]|nr:hypothetical protein CW304_02705 [Bacillus sp. UFRGS-B20]
MHLYNQSFSPSEQPFPTTPYLQVIMSYQSHSVNLLMAVPYGPIHPSEEQENTSLTTSHHSKSSLSQCYLFLLTLFILYRYQSH